MKVYRIAKDKYIRDLSGTGAKKYGGRWNQKGTDILYTSQNASLAVLETLVHAQLNDLPTDLKLLCLQLPNDSIIKEFNPDNLPKNWRDYPSPNSLAEVGSDWAASRQSLILKVPSVVLPTEMNILINPSYPEFEKVEIDYIVNFEFDKRYKD